MLNPAELLSTPLVFCDTETTSLIIPWLPNGRRVWEATLKRVEPGGAVAAHVTAMVTDQDLTYADPVALDKGGFYERSPLGVRSTEELEELPAYTDESEWMSEHELAHTVWEMTRGAHLVGTNVPFDADSFSELLYRHGLPQGVWHYHVVDTSALAAGALGVAPPYESRALSAALGVDRDAFGTAHTSAADTAWAEAVFYAALRHQAGRMHDLDELLAQECDDLLMGGKDGAEVASRIRERVRNLLGISELVPAG